MEKGRQIHLMAMKNEDKQGDQHDDHGEGDSDPIVKNEDGQEDSWDDEKVKSEGVSRNPNVFKSNYRKTGDN